MNITKLYRNNQISKIINQIPVKNKTRNCKDVEHKHKTFLNCTKICWNTCGK